METGNGFHLFCSFIVGRFYHLMNAKKHAESTIPKLWKKSRIGKTDKMAESTNCGEQGKMVKPTKWEKLETWRMRKDRW